MSSTATKDYRHNKVKQEEGPDDQAGFPESYEPLDGQRTDHDPQQATEVKVKQQAAASAKRSGSAANGTSPSKAIDSKGSGSKAIGSDKSERPTH